MFDKRLPLAFVHIPKTSGTSMVNYFGRLTSAECHRLAFDPIYFGDYADFDSFDVSVQRTVAGSQGPASEPMFLSGHSALSTFVKASPKAQLVTVLREPVSRLVSLWLFWRNLPEREFAKWGRWREVLMTSRGSLADFLGDRRTVCQTDNIYARALLWPHAKIDVARPLKLDDDGELLAECSRKLSQFAFCEAIEDPAFSAKLERWSGAQIEVPHLNKTFSKRWGGRVDLVRELSDAAELIATCTRLDQQIWSSVIDHQAREPLRLRSVLSQIDRSRAPLTVTDARQIGAERVRYMLGRIKDAVAQ